LVRVTELARENGDVLASGFLPGFSYPLGDRFA